MILNDDKPSIQEALIHFGVKGMKWGKRKARDVVSKEDRKLAKENFKKGTRVALDRKFERFYKGEGSIASMPYSKLSTKDRTIKTGATFYRTTARMDEQYRGRLYVSTNKADAARYRAVMPATTGRGGKKAYKQNYEHMIKVTNKLTLPSEKARMDAFYEVLNTPSIKMLGGKTVTGREFLVKTNMETARSIKNLDNAVLGQRYFEKMNQTATMDTPFSSAYFNKVRAKGYNAILDDNDAGIISRDPLILLNPNGTVKKMTVKPLTNADVTKAQQQFSVDFAKDKR